ncbi:hypothetical protein [Gracilibacillus salinarum]|uniref:Uncharacterized protein n=1 Tax=Gracilibacillus salinarum TaxID=2932255 RepID=A0ABY4GIV6_9BACI|nr:hypothetical protein [Gracilibacillus salinarum]UOQ84283.1 hypothetical protein MUN87_16440 [Gracilibacillus salinarum]
MNQKLLLFILTCTFFVFLTGFSNTDTVKKAMWVEHVDVMENGEELLQNAKDNGYNVLYVKTDPEKSLESYSEFIRSANESGIEIHALGGEPSWSLSENQQKVIDFVEEVQAYNERVSEEVQFSGIHLKIQPQYLPEWYEDQSSVIKQWKSNLTATLDALPEDTTLETSSSMPFWLDDVETPGESDVPFHTWLIRQFDHTTILAYRDTLEGPNGIVHLTKDELETADKYNKQIVIGLTLSDTGQDHTTFFEEGLSDMAMHRSLVDKYLSEYDSYVGTAVDDFSSWQKLKENPPTIQEKDKQYRGTYIWEAETLINEKDKILEFAKEKNINLLYTRLDLTQPYSAYSDFVEEANKAGIEIHAMGGHPSWALKEEEERMLNLVDYVKDYNNTVEENQKFAGIHLDVEPYVTPSWAENEQEVLSQWMDNIELFVKETKRESDLEASMDLAMWFDDTSTPGHPDTPFYEWVINQMDHTSIMAFRDEAKGSGGILDVAKNEMNYAESADKNMIISVELKENKNNPHISFHDEGADFMEEQLSIVDEELSSNSAYNGHTVHAYRYWRDH